MAIAMALCVAISGQESHGGGTARVDEPSSRLVDQFGSRLSSEDRSVRFDHLFSELLKTPNSIAYVVLYCGKTCKYGEVEAHMRGIEIKIALRKFDHSKLVVVNGGFRDKFDTELWLVENKSAPPEIKPTVNIKYVTFAGTTRRTFEYYDCCDDYRTFWKNLKP